MRQCDKCCCRRRFVQPLAYFSARDLIPATPSSER
jgi:hypothetical protein